MLDLSYPAASSRGSVQFKEGTASLAISLQTETDGKDMFGSFLTENLTISG